MYLLNGTVKGKVFEDKLISARDLIDLFDLPVNFDAKKKYLAMELMPNQIKRDRLNGGTTYQIGKMLRSKFSGSYKGDYVDIQYYRNRSNKRISGENVRQFFPHHVSYSGNNMAFSLEIEKHPEDLERLVFFMLHPKCKDSPLVNSDHIEKYYRINDQIGKAQEKNAKRTRMVQVMNLIMNGEDLHLLRTKAAGLNIAEHTMEDDEVRDALMTRAEQDIEKFWKSYESVNTSFSGLVQRALESGVIIEQHLGGGVQAYGFNHDISRNNYDVEFQEISKYISGQNGKTLLKEEVMKNPGMIDTLNQLIQNIGLEKKVDSSLSDDMFKSTPNTAGVPMGGKVEMPEDEFEIAANWALNNNLIDLKTDKAVYKHDKKTTYKLGVVNLNEALAPQIAFVLSQEEGKKAMHSLKIKMNQ